MPELVVWVFDGAGHSEDELMVELLSPCGPSTVADDRIAAGRWFCLDGVYVPDPVLEHTRARWLP